ncbi:helix-turn-helix transcriptional regulator [Aminiphilus sp.]|uniref:helix-turn-helix domain-containing protein n=1 Tax=Aminiphilus sp. TaxID=1872488 RepID=UPI00261B4E4E|nr:helix-turn-helix transcriptional regulator [Aminiphilus sp.]
MADDVYKPVLHNHEKFLSKAMKTKAFATAYTELEEEQALARELLTARKRAGLTQEQVAAAMGTTKSAVSRLEASNGHAPSLRTLRSYARAVGCAVEIRFVAKSGR